ncbi:hypothetical protein YC2023_056755 [Brassica napus]
MQAAQQIQQLQIHSQKQQQQQQQFQFHQQKQLYQLQLQQQQGQQSGVAEPRRPMSSSGQKESVTSSPDLEPPSTKD